MENIFGPQILKGVCAKTLIANCTICPSHIRGLSPYEKCDFCTKRHEYVGAWSQKRIVRACSAHFHLGKKELAKLKPKG